MSGSSSTARAPGARPVFDKLPHGAVPKALLGLTAAAGLAALANLALASENDVVFVAPMVLAAVGAGLCGWARYRDPAGWYMLGMACLTGGAARLLGGLDPTVAATSTEAWVATSLFYVFSGVGAAFLLAPRVDPITARMAIDGLISGLATAALAAAFAMSPLSQLGVDQARALVGVSPAVPIAMVGLAVGLIGLANGRAGRTWRLLFPALVLDGAVAIGLLWIADPTANRWAGVVAGLWPLAAVLVCGAAAFDDERESIRADDDAIVSIPAVAGGVATLLVSLSLYVDLGPWVTTPALLSLVGVGVRSLLTLKDVRALTDSRRQARTDDLTGLANRRYFYERLEQALMSRSHNDGLAVLMVDLDRFKEINDSLGHHAGDQILRLIGPRLTPAVGVWDLLARLGGDEFAVLVDGGDLDWARQTAERLRTALSEPFPVGDVHLHVDASVGIALWPDHAADLDELLARADIAMYRAKEDRSGVRVYEDRDDAPTAERLHLLELLRAAVNSDDPGSNGLVLHYQPKLRVATGDVEGVEALVRFDHPDGTLLFPDRFIAMVENAGLMAQLTVSVMRTALRQCRAWRRQGIVLTVAVNVSTTNLLDLGFPHLVMQLLKEHDLPPSALLIEITESSFMRDRVRCLDVLHRLRAVGVKISVDDYGTGHSSLAYLRDLPADELKLDRTFVQGMEDPKVSAIVASTVALAHELGLKIVAEGVETDDDLDRLRTFKADAVQGYLLSRPLGVADFTHWYVTTYLDGVEPELEPEPEPLPEPVAVPPATTDPGDTHPREEIELEAWAETATDSDGLYALGWSPESDGGTGDPVAAPSPAVSAAGPVRGATAVPGVADVQDAAAVVRSSANPFTDLAPLPRLPVGAAIAPGEPPDEPEPPSAPGEESVAGRWEGWGRYGDRPLFGSAARDEGPAADEPDHEIQGIDWIPLDIGTPEGSDADG